MDLYKSRPGSLVRVSVTNASLISIQGFGALRGKHLMATGCMVNRVQVSDYQMALSSAIYPIAFGEGVGALQVSGMIFVNVCGGGRSGSAFTEINSYYSTNSMYFRENPVRVAIGASLVVSGYLETMNISVQDSEFGAGNFSFGFRTVPKSKKQNGGGIQETGSVQETGGL